MTHSGPLAALLWHEGRRQSYQQPHITSWEAKLTLRGYRQYCKSPLYRQNTGKLLPPLINGPSVGRMRYSVSFDRYPSYTNYAHSTARPPVRNSYWAKAQHLISGCGLSCTSYTLVFYWRCERTRSFLILLFPVMPWCFTVVPSSARTVQIFKFIQYNNPTPSHLSTILRNYHTKTYDIPRPCSLRSSPKLSKLMTY